MKQEPTRPAGALLNKPAPGTLRKRVALVAASAVVSVAAWTGAPLLAIWVGSRLQENTQPEMQAIAGVVITLAVCEFVLVTLLATLNDAYDQVSGRRKATRVAPPWYSSMRGEREVQVRRDEGVTPIERVAALSCGAALLAFEVWFFFFAGASIPNA
jgi:hypothetical protein